MLLVVAMSELPKTSVLPNWHPMKASGLSVVAGFLLFVSPAMGENVFSKEFSREMVQAKRENYLKILEDVESFRTGQRKRFREADASQKTKILAESRQYLHNALINEVAPAWFGTPWAFSGTSTTPGEGKIACGYFVSTCIVHLGFKVDRIKLAQQPSQRIIETFMSRAERDILAGGRPMGEIRDYLRKGGDGVYIVGLDTHVGFVSVFGDDMAFIHSSYYPPNRVVMSESIDSRNPLRDSQYRVFGKLLSDDMMVRWLTEREFTVKTK